MTIAYAPFDCLPGDMVTLSIVGASSSHFALTSVPSKSNLSLGPLYNNAGNEINTFVPDVSGIYGVSAFEVRDLRFPSAFPSDPAGVIRSELVDVDTGEVFVCDLLDLFIVDVNGNRFRTEIIVRNGDIVAAETADPNNSIMRVVLLQPSVQAAVAALPGIPVLTLGEDIIMRVNELRAQYENHRINTGGLYHVGAFGPTPDTVNVVERAAAESLEEAFALLRELGTVLEKHLINVPPNGAIHAWHGVDDTNNPMLSSSPDDMRAATVYLADLAYRRYNRHLAEAGGVPHIHAIPDITNVMTAPAPLTILIVTILDELAKLTTTAPTGEQPGAVNARHMYGFDRTT